MSEHRSTPAFAAGGLQPSQFNCLVDGYVAIERGMAERLKELVERVLAFSGENPDRGLIQLQHDLAEVLQPSASTQPERSTEQNEISSNP